MPAQREVLRLDVDADLAEVPLHALPRAARGDAHLLVVVAGGAARGERVAQPVAVFDGDGVGDVGERGGALVRGDHEIGIVAVAPHDAAAAATILPLTMLSVTSSRPRMKVW